MDEKLRIHLKFYTDVANLLLGKNFHRPGYLNVVSCEICIMLLGQIL